MAETNVEPMVKIPLSIANELLEFKVRSLRSEIEQILTKWNQTSVEIFQSKTRSGEIPEAETEAIIIGNLVEHLNEYEELLQGLRE